MRRTEDDLTIRAHYNVHIYLYSYTQTELSTSKFRSKNRASRHLTQRDSQGQHRRLKIHHFRVLAYSKSS